MVFVRTLLLISLLALTAISQANESKYSGGFLNLNPDPDQFSNQHVLEFWGYHDYYGAQTYNDTLKLRYYQPLNIDHWRGTMRLDTSYISTYGPLLPSQSTGTYSAGNTLLTIWGNHPEILKNWDGTLGGRVVLPFGNYGQWAIGPQAGSIYRPAEGSKSPISDFSPLARYMYGFDSKNHSLASNPSQPPLVRMLTLYPTLGINLSPDTQIRFWDENGAAYNSAGGGWFVPIDAMVTHRINEHFLVAVGAAKQVVQTFQQYNWSVYSKLSFNF